MMKQLHIYETLNEVKGLNKEVESDGLVRLSGVFGITGIKNENKRTYNFDNYKMMVENLKGVIAKEGCPGELEHPDTMNINLENVSHKIEKIDIDENGTITGTIVLLNTPKGKIAQAIVEGGLPLYISSRACGTIDEGGNVTLSTLKTYDLVGTPGFSQAKLTPNQTMESLNENLCIVYENETTNNMTKEVSESSNQELDSLKEEIKSLKEELSRTKTYINNEFCDKIEQWLEEQFIPNKAEKMEQWLDEQFMPDKAEKIEQWLNEQFIPDKAEKIEQWLDEQFMPDKAEKIEQWLNEQFMPAQIEKINESIKSNIDADILNENKKEDITNEEQADLSFNEQVFNEELDKENKVEDKVEAPEEKTDQAVSEQVEENNKPEKAIDVIDAIFEKLEHDTNKKEYINRVREGLDSKAFYIQNMPDKYLASYQLATNDIKESIHRRAKLFNFNQDNALEKFWSSQVFESADNKSSQIKSDVINRETYIREALKKYKK